MIPFFTETNTDLMQRLLRLPEDIGKKIFFMWRDVKDSLYLDHRADEIAESQFQNDRERAEEISEDEFREDYWDCNGWHEFS
jgi:hypothetical protein